MRKKALAFPIMSDAQRAAQTVATPFKPSAIPADVPHPLKVRLFKFRLTLFLQPNHGFGESFHGTRRDPPHYF